MTVLKSSMFAPPFPFCIHLCTPSHARALAAAESVDYIVEVPGPSQANDHAHAVVFVIDTSGSMCVTTEVAGKVKLKGGDKLEKDAAALAQFTEGTNQFMHGQNRNVTYISRLQAVQAAVSTQIDRLAVESPNVKVSPAAGCVYGRREGGGSVWSRLGSCI